MNRFMLQCLVAVAAIAAGAVTFADEPVLPPQDRDQAFRTVDVDDDGWITREEASADPVIEANFDHADRDEDGRLSLAEFKAVPLNRSDQPGPFRNPERA
jgi:hypothetical protein